MRRLDLVVYHLGLGADIFLLREIMKTYRCLRRTSGLVCFVVSMAPPYSMITL
jgi:hypothetical protein